MPGPGRYQQIRGTVRKKKMRPRPKFPEVGDLKIGRQPSAFTPMNPAGLNNMNLVPKRKRKRRG